MIVLAQSDNPLFWVNPEGLFRKSELTHQQVLNIKEYLNVSIPSVDLAQKIGVNPRTQKIELHDDDVLIQAVCDKKNNLLKFYQVEKMEA